MGKESKKKGGSGEGRKAGSTSPASKNDEAVVEKTTSTQPIHEVTEAKVESPPVKGKKSTTKGGSREGREAGSTSPASKNEEAVVETSTPIHEVDKTEAKVESPNRASQKEKAKRASSSQPPVSKRKRSEITPNAEDLLPPSKPNEKEEEISPIKKKKSSKGEQAGSSRAKAPELDKHQRRNNIWWDYDNKEVPTDLEHNQVHTRMLNALQAIGFHGPIKIRAFVGYTDSNKPDMGSDVEIFYANKCPRPKGRPTTDNQAGDECMKEEIQRFIEDDSHSPDLENHLFISSDKGFSARLMSLMEHGYIVMNVTEGAEQVDGLEHNWDNWRLFLGLSKQRAYKNPSSRKQAESKKKKSKINRKERKKKAKEAKKSLIATAEDENSRVPTSISERDGGRVEMRVRLEIHTQKPVVVDIDDDSVHIVAKNADDLRQFICERLKSPIEDITLEELQDNNKWRVVVPNKSIREIYVVLTRARKT